MATRPILVIGGKGKTGRRVIDCLSARQLAVRGVSRSSQPAFDWDNPGTWSEALRGVGAVYVTYYPDVALPGSREAIQSLVQQARDSDVSRLVLLSGRGEPEAQRCEEVVRGSGLDWSILRSAWFAQNFSETFLQEPIVAGEVSLPVGDVGEPFVDVADIADVAVAALTEDRHAGQLYQLTGPRLLTFFPRGPGRPQRLAGRRRPAGAGPPIPRLWHLRARRRRRRRLAPNICDQVRDRRGYRRTYSGAAPCRPPRSPSSTAVRSAA